MPYTIEPIDDAMSSVSMAPSASAPIPPVAKRSSRSGPTLVPYTPSEEVLKATGWTAEFYDKYRRFMASKEAPSYSAPFILTGSKATPEVGGQYQLSWEEINNAAKYLKIDPPDKKEYLENANLQERLFDAHTLQSAKDLSKYPVFADADPARRAGLLAGVHLGGVGNAEKGTGVLGYLAGTGNAADKFGSHVGTYVNLAERAMGGEPVGSVGNWVPSSNAIASEQRRSNTDVVNMSPEEYLSLLPPVGKDESSLAKRDNLRKSLAAGDQIEAIPSLEVKPVRGDLKIVDHDGRNRAHAAIDAGLDTIPVSIRGVEDSGDYKSLVGEKTVPINFEKVSSLKAEPLQAQPIQQAQLQPKPLAAPAVGPGAAPLPPQQSGNLTQPTVATSPIPPIAQAQSKPDFYPQIVAGVNKDIINPVAQGYRGVNVPNPTDNVTAGQRIANANATSAGQVGLPPTTPPANALTSALSMLNPIGSAQAAEVNSAPSPVSGPSASAPIPPATPVAAPTPKIGGYTIEPASAPGDVTVERQRQQAPYIPGVSDVVPPIINALSPMVTALPADIAAFRSRPANYQQWLAARNAALAETQLPETPTGQKISKFLGFPGQLLGWAAEQIIGDKAQYLIPALDVLAPASMVFPGLGKAVTAPIRPIANRVLRTPEMADVNAINRAFTKETAAGGKSPSEIASQMQQAQAAGIPLTPMDTALPGEGLNALLTRSLEQSPAARGVARNFAENRTQGTEIRPGAERAGGTLERFDQHVTDAFGTGSAVAKSNALEKSLQKNTSILADVTKRYENAKVNLANQIDKVTAANQDLTTRELAKVIKNDPDISTLHSIYDREAADVKTYNDKVTSDTKSLEALTDGQNIFSPKVRAEEIAKFVKSAKPEALNVFRMSVGDAVRDRMRRVRELGAEPGTAISPQNIRNKLSAALGGKAAADDFLNKVGMEAKVTTGSANVLSSLGAGERAGLRAGAPLRRAFESLGHIGMGAVLGHGLPHAAWQVVRGARNVADYLAYGGGFSGSRRGLGITNALLNPKAAIDTSGKNLLQVPALSARRQATLNVLPYTPGLAYSASQNYAPPQP